MVLKSEIGGMLHTESMPIPGTSFKMREFNGTAPVFEATEDYVKAIMYSNTKTERIFL